jgi:hypothetical protein
VRDGNGLSSIVIRATVPLSVISVVQSSALIHVIHLLRPTMAWGIFQVYKLLVQASANSTVIYPPVDLLIKMV